MSTTSIPSTPIPDPWAITDIRRLGKYYLLRKLAQGGMAEIFVAKQVGAEGFERNVVIKLMLEDLSKDPEFVQMFQDEAVLAAKLLQPNIVQIYDLGITDGRYYIAMEYLAGEDLQGIVRRCRERREFMPVPLAARIIKDALDGLEFAHQFSESGKPLNIVHRDISPSNILVTYQGLVKIVDFGIAKAESKLTKTSTGTVKGKWVYMSPEQARGNAIDQRSDLFSLGLTFFELLTCRCLFRRDNELAVLRALLTERIPPASELRSDIPPEVDAILAKALSRNVEQRYASAGAMRADLETYLAKCGVPVGPVQLRTYLRDHFGQLAMEAKTEVPSLKSFVGRGLSLPADGAAGKPADAQAHRPLATPHAVGAAELGETRVAPVTASPGATSRWMPFLMGGVLAVVIAGAGAFGAVWLQKQGQAPKTETRIENPVDTTIKDPAGGGQSDAEREAARLREAERLRLLEEEKAREAEKLREQERQRELERQRAQDRKAAARPLEAKDINQAVGKARAKLMGCFEQYREAISSREGQVIIAITIASSGVVSNAEVETPGYASSPLGACIIKQVRQMKFPRHVDKEITAKLPFVYSVK